jgi:hypothetical protein
MITVPSKQYTRLKAVLCLCLAGFFATVSVFTWMPTRSAQASQFSPSSSATHFIVSCSTDSVQPGVFFQITVEAVDTNSKPVTSYNGKVNFASNLIYNSTSSNFTTGSICNLPEGALLINGVGTFSATAGLIPSALGLAQNSVIISISVTDATNIAITGTSGPILVQQAENTSNNYWTMSVTPYISMFAVTAPNTVVAGEPIECKILVLETQGYGSLDVATGYSTALHVCSSDPAATLPDNATIINGIGTFSVTLNTPGSQTVSLSDNNAHVSGASGAIAVLANPAKLSSDANLSGLTASLAALAPSFTPDNTSYTCSINNNVGSITITPTTDDPNAAVMVNGIAVSSGQASGEIKMNVGANNISIVVTAQDGTTTKTYTVAVSKAAATSSIAGTTPPIVMVFTIGNTSYSANGQPQSMDAAPIISGGRTLLPIKYVATPLGATVNWNQAQQMVTVSLGGKTITLVIGQDSATVNGVPVSIDSTNPDVVPVIMNGRTMLPLAFITKNLGCSVDWNGNTQDATVTYPAS